MNNIDIMEIISKYDYLQKAFNYIINHNKSNGLPYHNLNHMLTVTKNCYLALDYYGLLEDELTTKHLLLTAITHDANHSGGKFKDDVNIAEAKIFMVEMTTNEKIDVNIGLMFHILDATQYPYVIETANLDHTQSIIRDADLMQVYEPDWVYQHIFGLSQEKNIPFKEIAGGVKDFLLSLPPITSWATEVKEKNWEKVVKKLDLLVEITKQ